MLYVAHVIFQGHVSIYVMNQTLELEFLLLLNKMQH